MAGAVDRSSPVTPDDLVHSHDAGDVQKSDSKEFASDDEKQVKGVDDASPEYTRELGGEGSTEVASNKQRFRMLWVKYKWIFHLTIWLVWTG
jgi:hypothetical protein